MALMESDIKHFENVIREYYLPDDCYSDDDVRSFREGFIDGVLNYFDKGRYNNDGGAAYCYRMGLDTACEFSDHADEPICYNSASAHRKPAVGMHLCMDPYEMDAEVLYYRDYNSCDILFEDGSILISRPFDLFLNKRIKPPLLKRKRASYASKYLGQRRMMTCDMYAEIVRYRVADDIDVRFEDGYVAKNKSLSSFKRGEIANPNRMGLRFKYLHKYTGATKTMKCGMDATILKYNGSEEIMVRFSDGTVVFSTMEAFKKGCISNPNMPSYHVLKCRDKYLGKIQYMECGMLAEIISYRGYHQVDIRFEDGYVAKKQSVKNFLHGKIINPFFFDGNYFSPKNTKVNTAMMIQL